MKVLFGVILVLFILILLWSRVEEDFDVKPDTAVKPDISAKYIAFSTKIYNPFMVNWEKAIVSSIGLDAPAPTASTGAPSKKPTKIEMNKYIENLSQKIGKPLPPLTDLLPKVMNPQITIPSDPVPFTNALKWMNTLLAKSHENLGSALKGGNPSSEGFIIEGYDKASICQQDVQCPKQCQQQCQPQTQDPVMIAAKEKVIGESMLAFEKDSDFQGAFKQNIDLMEKSKKIQNSAESGELLNQLDLPKEDIISYSLPKGSDALLKMKSSNPAQYAEYQKNFGQLFSLKNLMDQINGSLR